MKFILNIITVLGIGILIMLSGYAHAGTRIIGIDGSMDPDTDSQGQPQETALDRASSALLRDAMDAIKKYRPNADEDYLRSYDDVVNFLKNLECECGDTLYFIFNGHGSEDGMWFSKEQDPEKRNLEYKEFLKLLEEAKKDCCCKIYFLINACYSGSAIDELHEDEHVKGIYTAVTRDTCSYYFFDSLANTLDSWLRRMTDRINEIDSINREEEDKTSLEDALDDAFGKARDKVPPEPWFDGEHPQGFRRDTFAIYGHIRKIIKDGDQNYAVIEVYDPQWRRGELDSIKIEQDDLDKLRKCKWVNTTIVYKDPFGIREVLGPITDAENPKDVLITGHVMAVSSGKVKVHVTWPRHMYCREIWLKTPPARYVKPERELPKVPKATRHNREERKRIREEIKRIKEELKEHKREYRRNARHRRLSVCRWVQQDINITDPTASGEAVSPLKPFGRYLGGLYHVKKVDRKKGTIRVGSRSGWLKRYGYRKMIIPDSTLAHLDTLFKDRRGRTRPLKYCDNIWITFWLPGSRDSMPKITDARRVLPHEQSSAEQTSLVDPTIIQTNNSTMVIPEINIINNDETAYDARVHLNIFETNPVNTAFDDSLTALVYLMSSTDMELASTESDDPMMVDIVPPATCQDWISNRLVSPKKSLENIQKDIYSIFRAFYLQGYLARSSNENTTQSIRDWINTYTTTTISPSESNSNNQYLNNQRWISLQNNYPTTYQNQNQFNKAYLHSVLNCNSEPIGQELENVWNNVKSDVSTLQSANTNSSNNLSTYLQDYLQAQLMSNHGNIDANDANCLQKVADYLTNLALTHSNLYSEGTPSFSSIKLSQTINETLVSNSSKSNSNTKANPTSPSYQIDILGLPETEQEQVRFESIQLKEGKKYTAQYSRGDRIADEDNKSLTEADLNYEGQEVLSITFFIEEDNNCACPDPNVLQTQAHATGEMTGVVYILHVVNIGESTALCNVGPYLAPGNKKTQTLFLPERHQVSLLPGEETFIPLQGYCLDHHLLPPFDGTIVDPSKDWINLSTSSLSSPPDMNFFSDNLNQTENRLATTSNRKLLYPGHDKPLVWKYTDIKSVPDLERGEYFQQLAFLNNQVLSITNRVYDNLYYNDQLNTPLGNTGYAQKELIQQQILWKYNSALQNNPYTLDIFHEKAMNEIKEELPKSEYKTSAQKAAIEKGLKEIWDQTELIGIKAKLWK